MDYYFKGEYSTSAGEVKPVSKFLQLLHKEGLAAFKLINYKLDENKFTSKDALILEQFYLLNKEFNLNTGFSRKLLMRVLQKEMVYIFII